MPRGSSTKRGRKMGLDLNRADSVAEAEMEEELRMSRADAEDFVTCEDCGGSRLNEISRHVYIGDAAIEDIAHLSAIDAAGLLQSEEEGSIRAALDADAARKVISRDILIEIDQRLAGFHGLGVVRVQRDDRAGVARGYRHDVARHIGVVGLLLGLGEQEVEHRPDRQSDEDDDREAGQ